MTQLSVAQRKALYAALVQAFPSMPALRVMATEGYGVNHAAIFPDTANQPDAVSQLITHAVGHERIAELIAAARADNPTHSGLRRIAETIGLALRAPDGDYEAVVVKQAGFQSPEPWRDLMSRREPCVFRIEVDMDAGPPVGIGTGFLVGPGAALTCDHVFAMNGIYAGAVARERIRARFDFKRTADGQVVREGLTFGMLDAGDWVKDRSEIGQLDYALFELDGTPGEDRIGSTASPRRSWLAPSAYVFAIDEAIVVLQHAAGRPLELSMGPVKRTQENRLWHKANTEAGSSGAPCFNAKWELAALHHHGSEYAGENRAVPMAPILAAIAGGPGAHLLQAPAP